VLERTREAGKKILMSGGSRSNVLPGEVHLERDYFTGGTEAQLRSLFRTWSLKACQEWLESPEQVGIELALEEETNKWFPKSNSAKEVRDRLVQGLLARGINIRYNTSVEGIHRTEDGRWSCKLEGREDHITDRLIVATGGLSFPLVGTDGTGHRLLNALGHTLVPTYPALTPLTGPHPNGEQLAGVSLYAVNLRCVMPKGKADEVPEAGKGKRRKNKPVEAERTGLLLTHKGYSGPSVLDLSHHAVQAMERREERPRLLVDWSGDGREMWEQRLNDRGKGMVSGCVKKHLPNRLADALVAECGLSERKLSELKKDERKMLLDMLTEYDLNYQGHQGYKKAEVTGGGVPLDEIDLKTLQSKKLPGLYLCGEVIDVFGRIGGFNFYWAWLSGRLAGRAAATMPSPPPPVAASGGSTVSVSE